MAAAAAPIHALYAHRRQLAPRVQLFIHWLAGLLAAHLGAPQRRLRLSETPRGEGKRLTKEAGKAALAGKPRRSPLSAGEGGILQQAQASSRRTRPAGPREVAPFLPQMAVEGPAGQFEVLAHPIEQRGGLGASCHSCWRMSVITLSQ